MKINRKIIALLFLIFSFKSYSEYYTLYHKVKKGESLYTIGKKYGKTPQELKKLNNLKTSKIFPGQRLIVGKKEIVKSEEKKIEKDKNLVKQYYIVKKGDCLYKISKKFGVSISYLKKINNLKSSNLRIGQKLIVGIKKIEQPVIKIEIENIKPIANVSKKVYYKVKEGDTIESIGEQFGIEPEKILEANLIRRNELKVGQVLVIPPKDKLMEETDAETKIDVNSNLRAQIIEETFKYLGTRYKFGGESKSGVDCSGLTRLVYKAIGIILPQNSFLQYKNGIEVKKEDALPGDLVFFKRGNRIGHVGVYIGNNLFVHASYTLRKVIISSLEDDYFKRRFAGFRRYISDEESYFVKKGEDVYQE